ncbi:MAG: hydrogenase [Euryarchaeota archaeon]|jgi:hydrogenase-4 component E|nr:hydrogenase [Euryarchaeota archaeon]
MDLIIYENIIDICAICMLVITVMAVMSTYMRKLIQLFAIHSLFLAVLAFVVAFYTDNSHIYITFTLTLVLKVLLIPRFLDYTVERIHVDKEVRSPISTPGSLLICTVLIFAGYLVADPMTESLTTLGRNCLAISLSIVFIGLYMMASRANALSESIGLLLTENGLFLGTMTISYGMPLIVEFGVFFDIIIAVVIIGIFAYRINRTFNSIDTSYMRRLRD